MFLFVLCFCFGKRQTQPQIMCVLVVLGEKKDDESLNSTNNRCPRKRFACQTNLNCILLKFSFFRRVLLLIELDPSSVAVIYSGHFESNAYRQNLKSKQKLKCRQEMCILSFTSK